jgi:subtilisin family serine protease
MATRKKPASTGDSKAPPAGIPEPIDGSGRYSVLVEMRYQPGGSGSMALGDGHRMDAAGFEIDHEYEPVSMGTAAGAAGFAAGPAETFVVRGTVRSEKDIEALRARPEVAEVWRDTPIAPFPNLTDGQPDPQSGGGMAGCPIAPCDCDPATPKGTIADVAAYLGVDQIWARGIRGTGMVVGVLDSGMTAQGRPVKDGETSRRIPRVIGGWPSDWGTESSKWGNHGNMCATDVLGMAPDAQLFDLRIAGSGGSPGTISRALQAFNWAINQFRTNGTPQVLTNSWGIFQEAWDNTYARNPNHPFTRKVVEAINEGMLVLFAAGNCGDTCPDGRCGGDVGPGSSIWGANGHPMVMTVGAVNKNEQFIGYSSRGPAALDPNKPDFCSISHFTGYNTSDSGTSAATPILAGAVALLKQAKAAATQAEIKSVLKATAKDIGPAGFDQHSGAGIVQIKAAYDRLVFVIRPTLVGPGCPRPTLAGPGCPRPTLVAPSCPRPTLIGPRCPRPTLIGPRCPRPTLFGCPRPTLTGCPRPTLTGCPRPTLTGCPRPTLTGCPRPTLAGCPRPTLAGCPRPTLAGCPRPTLAGCPRVTLACPIDPIGSGFESEWDDAAWAAEYAAAYGAYPEHYWPEEYWAAEYDAELEAYYSGGDYGYDDEEY